eukprot:Sspe_Gene.87850::Locus_59802_Transcript_1_1_Confidence_1.000_Length_453::g.87850::m.87850
MTALRVLTGTFGIGNDVLDPDGDIGEKSKALLSILDTIQSPPPPPNLSNPPPEATPSPSAAPPSPPMSADPGIGQIGQGLATRLFLDDQPAAGGVNVVAVTG